MKTKTRNFIGPLLVALAAMLWATDAIVRNPLSTVLNAQTLMLITYLLGLLLIAPWILLRHRTAFYRLSPAEWLAAIIFGIGGSAIGDSLFLSSSRILGNTLPLLIIKLQPFVVVVVAYFLLSERPRLNYWPWAFIAVPAAILMTFPDYHLLSHLPSQTSSSSYFRGVLLALSAMGFWGLATVAAKFFLKRHPASVSTFWRWTFAAGALFILLSIQGSPNVRIPWYLIRSPLIAPSVIYLSSVAGVLAMWIYYAGLKRTAASRATFIELLYPLAGALMNWGLLGTTLPYLQVLAGALLFLSIVQLIIPKT